MPGSCVVCGASLGSVLQALQVALNTSVIFGVFWVFLSWVSHMQIPWIALGFGYLVSRQVSQKSGGRGFWYQSIATFFTLTGITIADAVVVMIFWKELYPDLTSAPSFYVVTENAFLYDPATIFFAALGVMGGLTIWEDG